MKDRITIGTKLMISAGGLLALLVILSYASLQAIATLDSHLDVVANKTAKKVSLAGRMQTATAEMRAAVRSEILSAALNTGELESAHEAFVRAAGTVEESIRQIRPLLTTARGRAAVDRLAQNLTAWMPLEEEMARLCAKGLLKEANQLRRTAQMEAANAMNESAGEVLTILEEQLAEAAGAGAQAVVRSRWTALLLLGLGLAAGAAVLFVVRLINRRLRQFAAELREGAEQTAGAASQVSLSSQAVAQGANEQASSLEETSASSEQVKAAARQNSENSRVAAELVQRTQDGYSAANVSLEQAVAAMAEINDQSGKIAKIIKVIDEIAFQTNILALNAAVEAARAGEAGMGFAVVADEVRSLAQRSAQAARDTAALIEESISKSAAGKAKVDQVAVAIRAITEEELRVKALVDEVNLGSQEQARGIEQIGQALSQIEEVTQRAAANAEESASAAEQLHAQSEALMGLVERLTAMVDGQASGSSRPQPPLGRRGRAQQPPALSDGAARPRGDAGTSASMGLTATAQPRTAGSQAGGSLQGS